MRHIRRIIVVAVAVCLAACEGTTFRSSVPTYPVRINIDTRIGEFVHFQPSSFNSYIIVNREGYFLDGKYVLPVTAMDAWGYGGVVVFVGMNGYEAYDLACPYCASRGKKSPCAMDGIFAVCPECGERYDLGSGAAVPIQGIAREAMRRLNVISSDGKITVTQRQ